MATAYRYPNRRVAPGAAVDAKDMLPLTGLAVKSLITQPAHGATLPPGPVGVAGFAWAGEADIARVDISTDNGASWQSARLVGERANYSWRRFEHSFKATAPASQLILSRATDSNGVTQPAVSHWNPSGYLWNQVRRRESGDIAYLRFNNRIGHLRLHECLGRLAGSERTWR